jgi:hypothetical protein
LVLFFSTSSSTKKNSIAENVSHRCSSTRARSTPSAAAAAAAAAQSSPPAFFLSVFYRFISVFFIFTRFVTDRQTDRQRRERESVLFAVSLFWSATFARQSGILSLTEADSLASNCKSFVSRPLSLTPIYMHSVTCAKGKKAAPRERSTKKVKKKNREREKNSTLRLTTTHATNQPDTKDEGHIGLFCLSEIFLYI